VLLTPTSSSSKQLPAASARMTMRQWLLLGSGT
jgi:hypothetical protein